MRTGRLFSSRRSNLQLLLMLTPTFLLLPVRSVLLLLQAQALSILLPGIRWLSQAKQIQTNGILIQAFRFFLNWLHSSYRQNLKPAVRQNRPHHLRLVQPLPHIQRRSRALLWMTSRLQTANANSHQGVPNKPLPRLRNVRRWKSKKRKETRP